MLYCVSFKVIITFNFKRWCLHKIINLFPKLTIYIIEEYTLLINQSTVEICRIYEDFKLYF